MSDNVSPAGVKTKIATEIAKVDNPVTGNDEPVETKSLLKQLMKSVKEDDIPRSSKYTRYSTDMESIKDAYHALPYVYKFFWMIYRLSPVRTIIIIAVFILQGLLPALRLRTGGDFIRQVQLGRMF
jgi:hypothetical protein